ncbi:hypothetical protein PSACC_00861 [Paramicrosporidium saccamoebae]|uniref:Uncharacterized protein n=1 Tax=Paramicrosporidium saccamoebae TaxID=1246581 RepID=A0A2H9TNM7_9FUNG|nr:hypothetical protein PSACC_00861 [Paramicrosporidium saccamoebae]
MSCSEFAIRRAYNDFGPDLIINPVVADVLQQSMSVRGCASSLWNIARSLRQPSMDGTIEANNHWRPFLSGALQVMVGDSIDYAEVANVLARSKTVAEKLSKELARVRIRVKRAPEAWQYGMLYEQAIHEVKDFDSQLAFFPMARELDPKAAARVLGNILKYRPEMVNKVGEDVLMAMINRIEFNDNQAFTALPFITANYTGASIEYCAYADTTSNERKYVAQHVLRNYLRSGERLDNELLYRKEVSFAISDLIKNDWIPSTTFSPYTTALEDLEELMKDLALLMQSPTDDFVGNILCIIGAVEEKDRVITRAITPMLISGFLQQYFTVATLEEKTRYKIRKDEIFDIIKSEMLMDLILANIQEIPVEKLITSYVDKKFFSNAHDPYFARNSIPMAKMLQKLNEHAIRKVREAFPEMTGEDFASADRDLRWWFTMSPDLYVKRLFDIIRTGPPNLRQYYARDPLTLKLESNPEAEPYPVKWFSSKFMGGMLQYHDICNDPESLKIMVEQAKVHPAKAFWSEFVAATVADHYGRSEKTLVEKLKGSIQVPLDIKLLKDQEIYKEKQLGEPSMLEKFIEDDGNKVYFDHRGYPNCGSCTEDCGLCDIYKDLGDAACLVVDKLHTLWNSHGTEVFIKICSDSIIKAIRELPPTKEGTELTEQHNKRLKSIWDNFFASANAHRLEVGVADVPEPMFETMGSLPNRKLWTLYPILLNDLDDERKTKQRAALYATIKSNLKEANMWPAVTYLSLDPPPVSPDQYIQDVLDVMGTYVNKIGQYESISDEKSMLRKVLLKRYEERPELAEKLEDPEEEAKMAAFSPYLLEEMPATLTSEDEAKKMATRMRSAVSKATLNHWIKFMTAVPNPDLWKPVMQSITTVEQWTAFRKLVTTKNFEKLYSSSKDVLEKGSISALCQSIDAEFAELKYPVGCAATSKHMLLVREIGIIQGDVYGQGNSQVKKMTLPDCINAKVKIFTLAVENCMIARTEDTYNEPPDHLAKLHLKEYAPGWSYPTLRILHSVVFTRLESKRVVRNIPLLTIDKILEQALQSTQEYPFLDYDPPPPKTPTTEEKIEEERRFLDNFEYHRGASEPPVTIPLKAALEHYASQAINQDPTGSGITTKLRRDNLEKIKLNCPACKKVILREMRKLLFPMAERLSMLMQYDRTDYMLAVLAEGTSENITEAEAEAVKMIVSAFMEGPPL